MCQQWLRAMGMYWSSSTGYTISLSTEYIPQNMITTNWREEGKQVHAKGSSSARLEFGLTLLIGKASVVKRKSHDRKNQYFALLQGMMSVKKQRKK